MSKPNSQWHWLIPVLMAIAAGIRLYGLGGCGDRGGTETNFSHYNRLPGRSSPSWEFEPEPWEERSREFKNLYRKIDSIASGKLADLLPGVAEELNAVAYSDGYTLLMAAVRNNPDAGVVSALLEAGANPNVFDADGNSVLWTSLRNPNPEMLSVLLRGGADPNGYPVEKEEIARVLDAVANRLHGDEEQCLAWARTLIEAGAFVNPPPEEKHALNPLFAAVNSPGNVRMVRLLLDAGADVDRRFNDEATLVRAAGDSGNVDVVAMLLEASPDSLSQGDTGELALQKAASNTANSAMILLLTRSGAKADWGDRVLVLTAIQQKASLAAVQALLAAGAQRPDPARALALAAESNPDPQVALWLLEQFSAPPDPDVISGLLPDALIDNANPGVARVFIEKGADLRKRHPRQNEPMESLLSYALLNSRAAKGMCELLLANGIGWDELGNEAFPNPLSMAVNYQTFFDLADFMVETGVDVNGQNALGLGPIHYAAVMRRRNAIEMDGRIRELDSRNIETDVSGEIREATVREFLDAGATIREITAVEAVERLLSLGANPDLRDRHGHSALVYCLVFGNVWEAERMGRLFIEHGLDIDHRDHLGATSLMNALMFCKNRDAAREAAKVLIKLGADIEAVDARGATPLLYALLTPYPERNEERLVEALVNAGAVDAKGRTPVMHLAINAREALGLRDVIELLVEAGADIDARDKAGQTALDHAVQGGRPDIIHAFALASKKIPDLASFTAVP